jgi:p-cumate 2,3-dioxygenase alpha subunit
MAKLPAFYNTCSYRGALVCREHAGARRALQWPYHGWVYDDLGTLVDVPGRESMATGLMESVSSAPWGRPYAHWVPGWGEQCRAEIDEIARGLIARIGEERGWRISQGNRNTLIFPNLVINDIMAITIRTFYPVRPDYMEVSAWALAPVGETATSRDRRLHNFLEFLGPAAFPDDVETLEMCQDSYNNRIGVEWNDISKGQLNAKPERNDEEQMRVFWWCWKALLTPAARRSYRCS